MDYFNEEILLCTSCHHILSSKAILSGYAYCHPVLEVLICKRCYNRLSIKTASVSDKLCLWCGFPGKYTTCITCSSNFCVKCLKNNFNEDTFKDITKKKSWTCFYCLPELLSEHKANCAKVLKGMGNSQSLPKRRKRSNSESHMEPSKKYYHCKSYNVCSSDDELPYNEYSPATNTKRPSSADYTSTMEEIIEKASQLSLLFFEVNRRASKFRNKLKTQRCTLKVLQNAFTFNNDLLDTTIKTLKIWKEELANTENKWEQDFDISLIVSVPENGKSAENVTFNGIKEPNNSNSFHQSQSSKHEKRKKFKLSLKRSLESENTDDGMTEDSKENLTCLAVKSTLKDEELLLELEDDSKPEILEVPNKVQETEQNNDVPIIPETVAPDLDAEDSDHGSIFSEKTVILNFDELRTTKSLLENIKKELASYNDEFTKTQIDPNTEKLCETTGSFAPGSFESDTSQNSNNLCDNTGIGEDAGSETSFVFDISQPHSESNDSDVTELYDFDVCGEVSTPVVDDVQEKSQTQCTTEIENANEISPSYDVPRRDLVYTNDVHKSDSETHDNTEATNMPEHDEASNEQHKNKDKSERNADEENLKCNNEVADKHEPVAAPNEQNCETNNQHKLNDNSDEIVDSPKLSVTSNDPCCSHHENTDEQKINNADFAIKDDALETSFKVDIEATPLINDDISDLEVTKAKIDFFDVLGLYSNVVGVCENHVKEEDTDVKQENQDSSKNFEDAVKLLREDDSSLFDSDFDTSVTSVSDEEEEEKENKIKKDDEDKAGLISKDFPVLPKEAITVTNDSDKEMILNEDDVDTEGDDKDHEYQIKPCTVVLERLQDVFLKASTDSASENPELRLIERLTNLNNLDLKRKDDNKPPKKGKLKRRKIIKPSGSPGSESQTDYSDSDSTSLSIPSLHGPPMSDISCEGVVDALINFSAPTSDFDMDTSGTDCEDSDKKKKKRKTRAGSTESNKENQPDNQESDKSTPKELTAEELALADKRKWRNDPLLRTKLTESGSETESDGSVKGDSIVSEKTKKKMEALEENIEKRDTFKVTRKTSHSSELKSEYKDESLSSENDDDTESFKASVIINTDTDSDIEFISEVKKRSPKKSPKMKTSICISSDEDADQESDSEDESGKKKKGRKNIRAILSDETLEEATKRANLIEKQRTDRLHQKHTQMDTIISQSQNLSQEEGLILDINEETQSPLIVVNSHITRRLKPHQLEGVRFMWENCYEGAKQLQKDSGSGCILAHCMGLGKTFQVVALIHTLFAHSITKTKHVLVVCPLSIVLNWKNEFKQGLEGLNDNVDINIFCISERHAGIQSRLVIVDKWRQKTGVLVMGYEAYQRLTNLQNSTYKKRDENVKKALVDPGPDLVVLDEGHLLKNGKNTRTKALMKVKTKRRIILTGTPIQNNLKEYYYMVQFVKPNLLGSYPEYTNRFVNPITNGQFHDSTEEDIRRMKKRSHVLSKMMKATVQRYEAVELEPYLPGKFDYVLFIQPHILQAQLYQKYLDMLKTEMEVLKRSIISDYHKLRDLWTHPCLLHFKQEEKRTLKKRKEMDVVNLDPEINDADESPEGWWHGLCPDDYKTNIEYGPKFKVMLSIIQECEKIGDKVLIFSSSIPELNAIEFFLHQHSTPTSQWKPKEDYYRMDGTVLPDTRLQLCDTFNVETNKRTRVFLISNRVGGLGLNLIAANRVILMDVNWNPAYDIQSVFRIYRFGQTKQCYIYRLVSMGTMEEVVYQRQINKLAIAGRVVDEMQISRHYKSDDLQKMYRLDYDIEQERPSLVIPRDAVLATVIQDCEEIFKYHEHQSLLENKPEEELNEDEMKLAWDEFNRENENHNRQIEEQKKRLMAQQAGPSGVTAFLPKNTAKAPGPQNMNFKNNPMFNLANQYFKVPASLQRRTTNSTKTKEGAAQPEPLFEVVLISDNNKQAFFNSEETNQVHQQTGKPNELSKQFYDYIKQFSHEVQAAAIIKKLATPQSGGANQSNVSRTTNTTQIQSNESVVVPQILNTFTQSQASVNTNVAKTNRGYVLPKNVGSSIKEGPIMKTYGKIAPPSLKKVMQKTQAAPRYAVPQPSTTTNGTSSNGRNNGPNNIQIIRKTQFLNTSAEAQPSASVNTINSNIPVISKISRNNKPGAVVDLKDVVRKIPPINTHTEPQLFTNTSKTNSSDAVGLQKNVGNIKANVLQEIRTLNASPNPQPPLKTISKTSNRDDVANILDEIIDVDSDIPIISRVPSQIKDRNENKAASKTEQQKLIKSLSKNMNITLSVCEKPCQNTSSVLELSKSKVNDGGNQISISTIPQNNIIQSNSNDVIEID